MMSQELLSFLYFAIAVLICLTVHEASHALASNYLGDPTAKLKGRLTLNPIKHLDFWGTLVFIITRGFGWGKPVPVNPMYFKNPVRDSAIVSLAGPFSNFLLSFALVFPMAYLYNYMPGFLNEFLWNLYHISIFLGVFNLLPFPPLDGSKIIGLFIPKRYYYQYSQYLSQGVLYFLLIFLFDLLVLKSVLGFSLFSKVIYFMHDAVSMLLTLGVK